MLWIWSTRMHECMTRKGTDKYCTALNWTELHEHTHDMDGGEWVSEWVCSWRHTHTTHTHTHTHVHTHIHTHTYNPHMCVHMCVLYLPVLPPSLPPSFPRPPSPLSVAVYVHVCVCVCVNAICVVCVQICTQINCKSALTVHNQQSTYVQFYYTYAIFIRISTRMYYSQLFSCCHACRRARNVFALGQASFGHTCTYHEWAAAFCRFCSYNSRFHCPRMHSLNLL